MADAFGWRWAFYMVGIPGLIAAYLAWHMFEPERGVFDREVDAVTAAEDYGVSEVETVHGSIGIGFWTRAKKNLQVPTYLAVICSLVFSFFTIGGTSFWLPTYLVNTFSLSVGKAGITTGAVLASSGLVGTLVGGWLADYVQHRRPDGRLYWSVGNLVGAAIGFMFGGLVADAFGWRWAFYMVGIPGLIAAYLAWHTFEPERGVFDRESDAIYRSVRHWWHFAQLLHQADLCFSHWFDSRQVYPELCAHNNHSDVSFPGRISVPRWRKNCCTRHASYARADERQNR